MAPAFRTVIDRLGARLFAGLLAALLVLVLFRVLAVSVAQGITDEIDHEIRRSVNHLSSPALTTAMRRLTDLGSPLVLTPLTLAAAFGFLRVRRRRAAVLIVVTMLGVVLLDSGLKLVFQRARPVPFFGLPVPSSYSFPSGHALAAFCFFFTLAALLAVRTRSPVLRVLVALLAAAVVATVGLSRVYLGVHYPTDVIAGYAAGFIWVVSVVSVDQFFRRRLDARSSHEAVAERPVSPT